MFPCMKRPIVMLLRELKAEFPRLQYGYFNRTKENFFPDGFETEQSIR